MSSSSSLSSSSAINRPNISDYAQLEEKRRLTLIDRILAQKGALSIDDIYAELISDCGIEGRRTLFGTVDQLRSFITIRSNAFKISTDNDQLVSNRSIDYREAIGYLVTHIAQTDIRHHNLAFISSQLREHFPIVARCEIGSNYYAFVKEHESIFEIDQSSTDQDEKCAIELNATCMNIPSVWLKAALPEYKSNEIHYDRSITLVGVRSKIVSIVKASNYMKLAIIDGVYTNECVYVLGSNIGLSPVENVVEFYAFGDEVRVNAFKAYNAAQSWTATALMPIHGPIITHNPGKLSIKTPAASLPSDITSIKLSIDTLLPLELNRQSKIDECLDDNHPIPIKQLFQSLIATTLFSYLGQLIEYVHIRSHLYSYNSKSMMIHKHTSEYRHALMQLIQVIYDGNYTTTELHDHLLSNGIVDYRDLTNNSEISFDQFLMLHEPIFELTEQLDDLQTRYITLRGTYDKRRNVLIPRFYTQ